MFNLSKKPLFFLTLILLLTLGLVGCLKKPAVNTNQDQNINVNPIDTPNPYWIIDDENWKTFTNEEYSYQIDVPPGWEVRFSLNSEGEIIDYRQVCIGGCEGMKIYSLSVNILDNPNRYSSKEFVSSLRREYEEYCKKKACGSWRYNKEYETIIGEGYNAYELYNVFAYDQSEEQIFLAKGNTVIKFSFPIAKENPNLDNPIENNQLVHQALKTFQFIDKE